MTLVGATLVLMETTHGGDAAYRHGLGWLQYPFRWVWAAIGGAALPAMQPVAATRDLTDLLCLPALAGAWWIGTASCRRWPAPRRDTPASLSCQGPIRASSALLAIGLLTWSLPGRAQSSTVLPTEQTVARPTASPLSQPLDLGSQPPMRRGFFLRALPGFAFAGLRSDRSALSAFRQRIPSRATAYWGSIELQLGGAASPQLVFAGAIEQTSVSHVRVHVRDQIVAVEDLQFESISLGSQDPT
jgi:hypothetical protein